MNLSISVHCGSPVINNLNILSFTGDEAASFTKEEMQQGKHTEYEKNLHDELSMSSTNVQGGSSGPSPPSVGVTTGGVSAVESSMITATGSATYSSPTSVGLPGSNPGSGSSGVSSMSSATTVASVVANSTSNTTNGRAASEHSDKIPSSTSRTPSPHHPMANGGWPNLGMDPPGRSR